MIWRRTRSSVVCLVQRVGISRGGVGPTLLLAAGDQEDRIIVLYYGPVWFIGANFLLVACCSQQAESCRGCGAGARYVGLSEKSPIRSV